MKKTIIRNGTLITEEAVVKKDLLIIGEKIAGIGEDLTDPEADIIDASGKYVLPGGVDIHTHMDLDVGRTRAIDDFYTGTVAAACGGTTTIVDHMAFGPKGCSLWHQVREYHRLADGNAVVDYGFHGVIQHTDEIILREMGEIAQKEGITSFKVYLTYDHMLQDDEVFSVLEQARRDGILIAFHCENDGMIRHLQKKYLHEGHTEPRFHPLSRPKQAEAEAVSRVLHLAMEAGEAPVYIVHLSGREGLIEVLSARRRGQKHFGVETCPQYLLLTDEMYEDPQEGLKAVMSPPLRKAEDNEVLWEALAEGQIDVVATDHCPFTFRIQKQLGKNDFTRCPGGAPGVEERLLLMFSEGVMKNRITPEQLVKLCCAEPARVAGIYPQKGCLLPGSDADLVILDPGREHVMTIEDMHGAGDYTCYEGKRVRGDIRIVMQRGNILVKDHVFCGRRGDGRYLKRRTSSLA